MISLHLKQVKINKTTLKQHGGLPVSQRDAHESICRVPSLGVAAGIQFFFC